MIDKQAEPLRLGPDVIAQLIPHRRPLVMVDRVVAYRHGERPALYARRHIAANEPIFEGHFPGLHLWPGVYTIEGLGQTTLLCAIIALEIRDRLAAGGTVAQVLDGLRARERAATQPLANRPPAAAIAGRGGMAGQVDIKFLEPVYAGCVLDYAVTLTHVLEPMARFDVVASVDSIPVARGTMTGILTAR